MSVSLDSAIRTCKVNTGWASREESDRFLNPTNMLCPLWNGQDSAGRRVCPDSFVTKSRGCNSATDRVVVENNVSRPQYMEYITLKRCWCCRKYLRQKTTQEATWLTPRL